MDKDYQEKINNLEQQLEDIEQEKDKLKEDFKKMSEEFNKLKNVFEKHTHNNLDGSLFINNYIPKIAEPGDIVSLGNGVLFSDNAKFPDGSTAEGMVMAVGRPEQITNKPHVDYIGSNINLEHGITELGGSVGKTVALTALGKPQIINLNGSFSISSGGNTISAGNFQLRENEFTGCTIKIFKNGDVYREKEIISNTSSTLTIKGTWGVTESNVSYYVSKPVFLGSSQTRWNSLSLIGIDVIGDGSQRLGITIGGANENLAIYAGNGVPTSSAPNGSLYLRKDGGSTTTLYIRASGAWVAK